MLGKKQKRTEPEEGKGYWYFKLDEDANDNDPEAWQLYTKDEAKKIESAYFKGQKTVTVGQYVVMFAKMVQRKKDDKNKERKILRQCIHNEGPSTVGEDSQPVKKLQSLLISRSSTLHSTSSTVLEDFPPKKKAKKAHAATLHCFGPVHNEPALLKLLENLPDIEKVSLDQAAVRMRGPVRAFLHHLGRDKDEDGSHSCAITLGQPLSAAGNKDDFKVSKQFHITGKELKTLADTARVTTVFKKVRKGPFVKNKLSAEEEVEAHSIAVSGKVLAMFDNAYRSRGNSGKPFLAVSVPGLNFKYSKADLAHYTKGGKAIDGKKALAKMMEIWSHVLHVMKEGGVKWPVLCAIGCGAFKGSFTEVPSLWAKALVAQLRAVSYGFEGVVVSLPVFGKEDNYTEFKGVFEEAADELQSGVILTSTKAMITVAAALAEADMPSGILNPSDVQAVRNGKIGMFWDGGHTALEEVLAMQTTLLLQHVGVNPDLWSDPSRHDTVLPEIAKVA